MKKVLSIILALALALGVFAVGAGALTTEEIAELSRQYRALVDEALNTARDKVPLLPSVIPIGMLSGSSFDLKFSLKNGVTPEEYNAALIALGNELGEPSRYDVINDAILDFFGIDEFPTEVGEAYDAWMEALQLALADGSLKAALDAAVDAYLAEMQAVLDALNAALAGYFKPEAVAYAEEYATFAVLYMELGRFWTSLTDEEREALQDERLERLESELQASQIATGELVEEGKWDEARVLVSEVSEVLKQILTELGVIAPPATYTLTYNLNNGTGGPVVQTGIVAGAVVTLSTTAPTRAGYTFKGWAATVTGTAVVTSVTVNADTTVYAVWEQITIVDPPETDPILELLSFLPAGIANVVAAIVRYVFFGWLWGEWL